MRDSLKLETEKLARSWMQHDANKLCDYLVSSVEDPRLNVQSILSRHFLLRQLFHEQFEELMQQEIRFAAAMNWLVDMAGQLGDSSDLEIIHYALRRGADNAEGIQIPGFVLQTFASLPGTIGSLTIPNYVQTFLTETNFTEGKSFPSSIALKIFQILWSQILAAEAPAEGPTQDRARLSVLEPACGSANDYRFLVSYGIAAFLDYTGFDLCAKNIENAQSLFPLTRFEEGNVFELSAPEKSFDLCYAHDLLEHLSLEGLDAAVREICRVTRHGICISFFQMDERPEHILRPLDEYHWNLLSLKKTRALFAEHGFASQIIHVSSFLRQQFNCDYSHNSNAYTLILHPVSVTNPS